MQRLTCAFVSALILASPTLAAAQEAPQQAMVNFDDLNMSTDRGTDRALHRIRRAAEDVCDASTGRRTYEDRVATRTCISDAMGRAVDDLGNPQVAAKFTGSRQYALGAQRS